MTDEELKVEVESFIDEVWEDVVEDIRTLVRINSVEDLTQAAPGAPWGPAVRSALDTSLDIAKRLGLATTDVDGYIGFGEVTGTDANTVLATIAHCDIVPIGKGWTVDPLDVTRREGWLLGRGVIDDKGPLIISLWAVHFFARLAAKGEIPPVTLRALIGTNEETGMDDVDRYLERYGNPAFCFTPDANFPLICGEKGLYAGRFIMPVPTAGAIAELGGGTVSNAVPGEAWALLRVPASELVETEGVTIEDAGPGLARMLAKGVGGHASTPDEGVNAIGKLVAGLVYNAVLTADDTALVSLLSDLTQDSYGRKAGVASRDEVFGDLTLVASTLRTEDGKITLTVDSRYPMSTSAAEITQGLTKLATQYRCTYEQVSDARPFYMDPNCAEVRTMVDTFCEYAGREEKPYVIGGGTYARHFARACAFGPNDETVVAPEWVGSEHGPDEGVSEEVLRQALRVYIVSLARLMQLDWSSQA